MKKHISFQIILSLFSFTVIAQNIDCNRAVLVKQDEKKVPKGICIPKGYLISNIYKPTDINDDGLIDFVFKWRKVDLHDGDTMFVSVYRQCRDSSFVFLKMFSNLYPIYFKNYSLDYTPQDKSLIELHKRYEDVYPFIELVIEKSVIKIKRKGDATSDLIITYKFDEKLNNWVYEKCELNNFMDNTVDPYDLSEKLGPTIDNFTYFIWN